MERYLLLQAGSLAISLLLALTFVMLSVVGAISPENVLMALILIIIAIIMLTILSINNQILDELKRRSKK